VDGLSLPVVPVRTSRSKNESERPKAATLRSNSDGCGEVDAILEAWARWGRSLLAGIGWPVWTLLARVMEQGFTGAAQRGAHVFEVDEAMEMVERAVLRLSEIERRVIVKHYLFWQPPEVSARYVGVSYAHFRVILNRARRSVRDYLRLP
jgi:DNA-directed RNA polymerase specialized sigma24 family protein